MADNLNSINASPLEWPPNKPRTKNPKRSAFYTRTGGYSTRNKTVSEAREFLLNQLGLLDVDTSSDVVLSTNMATRKDGFPYSNAAEPEDSGVAVYFIRDGETECIPMDTYDRVADNIYAAGKVIESLRTIGRHGSNIMDAAFQGFKRLPEQAGGIGWWDVLGIHRDASAREIRQAYRSRAKEFHPDKPNGSAEKFRRVQDAFNQACAEKKIS